VTGVQTCALPISRKGIAKFVGITPEHLNHLFRQYTASTPMEYLTAIRLQAAKELLLNADLNVSEVAYQTGYNDPLYFSRVFKQKLGISPLKFAKRL
jgi:two-component system, response regulator YesN